MSGGTGEWVFAEWWHNSSLDVVDGGVGIDSSDASAADKWGESEAVLLCGANEAAVRRGMTPMADEMMDCSSVRDVLAWALHDCNLERDVKENARAQGNLMAGPMTLKC
jgi:hypothetical protein